MNSSEIGGGVIITSEVDQNVFGIKHFHVPPQCLQDPVLEEDLVRKKYLIKSKCTAYLSAAPQLNIPNATWTQISLDAIEFDTGSDFSLINSYFVVPRDGEYIVTGSSEWTGTTADKTYLVGVAVNGTIACYNRYYLPAAVSLTHVTTKAIQCSAGDLIRLEVFHNVGAATPDIKNIQAGTYLSVVEAV